MDMFRFNPGLAGVYAQVGVIVEAMHLLADAIATAPGGYNPYITLRQQLDSRRRSLREHAEHVTDLLKVVSQSFMTLHYLFEGGELSESLSFQLSFWPLFDWARKHFLNEAGYDTKCETLLNQMVETTFKLNEVLVRIEDVIRSENILQ